METYSQHIELINDYLNNLLSKKARIDFESKLQNDAEFNAIYKEHIDFINGLKRVEIKADVQKAKRYYTTEKWLKISGISIIAIGALVMLYTLVFNTSEIEPTPNNDNFNTILKDSITSKTPAIDTLLDISEAQIDTIQTTSQIDVNYTTTTVQQKFGGITTTKKDLTKRAQTIRFNTQNDTSIRCKEGTILKITKGSFINPYNNKLVTGTIDLNVTEYYKLSDILMTNLSTVSNGKQLETGGMLFIEATQSGTDLKLKDDKTIEISFPTTNKKPRMQLFSGEWNDENINWEIENIEELETLDIHEGPIDVPFNVVEQVPTFPGCETVDNNEVRKKCTSDAISKFISRKFNTDIALGLGLTGRQQINCVFKIDQEGNVIYVQSRASHPKLSLEADRVIASLPKMLPGIQRGKPVTVPYSLPIIFKVIDDEELEGNIMIRDTSLTTTSVVFDQRIAASRVEMDTIYRDSRGIVETIREVMHDKDFPVDSLFMNKWRQYKKQNLIRIYGVFGTNSIRTAKLRKALFEMEGTKFKILKDDSITRGGHVIRKLWDATQIPSSQVIELVPKQLFTAGSEIVTAEEFEARITDSMVVREVLTDEEFEVGFDSTENVISSRDVSYYVLKTSKLGWINCDRFINGRTKRIKYKLKIKNADGANINMVFKSLNSVLPSWYTNGVYDFQTVGANEDIILIAIKRKDGKLYYDSIETKTKKNPKLDFDFKEVSLDELKKELEQLNGTFK